MGKKPQIKLRVFRGDKLSYNQDGSVQNENQLISVQHGTNLWKLTMKNLGISGYCDVKVHKVFEEDGSGYKEVTDIKSFEKEVKKALENKKETPKTADQIRIENLEAKIEALLASREVVDESVIEDGNDKLKELQLEYFKLFKKKPHHMLKEEGLIEKIDNFKNK